MATNKTIDHCEEPESRGKKASEKREGEKKADENYIGTVQKCFMQNLNFTR